MKPYYSHGEITIYHADCREILNDVGKVHLTVTDPPYGMEFVSNYRINQWDDIHGDSEFDVDTIKRLIEQSTCAAYFFCRWDNLKTLPRPKSVLSWIKNNWSMGDLEHEHGRQWEAIAFYAGFQHRFIKRIPDVIFADRTGNDYHPTQKPVALLKQILAANAGHIVLDPYCGSGTTLIAAKELGRRAIGIEIEERHCETSAKRLSQEVFEFGE